MEKAQCIFALSETAVTYPVPHNFRPLNVSIGSHRRGGGRLAGEDGQRPRRDEGDPDRPQALHDTQSDHTKRLTRIEDKVGNIEGRVGSIEQEQ
jgi:hypothetical protein